TLIVYSNYLLTSFPLPFIKHIIFNLNPLNNYPFMLISPSLSTIKVIIYYLNSFIKSNFYIYFIKFKNQIQYLLSKKLLLNNIISPSPPPHIFMIFLYLSIIYD